MHVQGWLLAKYGGRRLSILGCDRLARRLRNLRTDAVQTVGWKRYGHARPEAPAHPNRATQKDRRAALAVVIHRLQTILHLWGTAHNSSGRENLLFSGNQESMHGDHTEPQFRQTLEDILEVGKGGTTPTRRQFQIRSRNAGSACRQRRAKCVRYSCCARSGPRQGRARRGSRT